MKEPNRQPDEPFTRPNNYSGQFYGAVSVRTALANSFNIPAVKAIQYAGIEHTMDVARRMGMEKSLSQDPSFYGLSLSLGAGEVQLLEHTNVLRDVRQQRKLCARKPHPEDRRLPGQCALRRRAR